MAEGMAVYVNGKLVGYTNTHASIVRKSVRHWDDVYSHGSSNLSARGACECQADTAEVAERIFARFGRAVVNMTGDWHNDPATNAQLRYLAALHVQIDTPLTKGHASQLIDAAKNNTLGSIGGFYTDGSN